MLGKNDLIKIESGAGDDKGTQIGCFGPEIRLKWSCFTRKWTKNGRKRTKNERKRRKMRDGEIMNEKCSKKMI
jgi:hypothetical protein